MTTYRIPTNLSNPKKKPSLVELFSAIPEGTTYLEARHITLEQYSLDEITEAFAMLPNTVTAIDLSFNGLGSQPKKLERVFKSLSKTKVERLNLENNQFTIEAVEAFSQFPKQIKHLDLSHNFYQAHMTPIIIGIFKAVQHLETLAFSQMNDAFSHRLFKSFTLENLKDIFAAISTEMQDINFGWIQIEEGTEIPDLCEKLRHLPPASSIRFLVKDGYEIPSNDLALLMQALPNSTKLTWVGNTQALINNMALIPPTISFCLEIEAVGVPIEAVYSSNNSNIPPEVTALELQGTQYLKTNGRETPGLPQIKSLTLHWHEIDPELQRSDIPKHLASTLASRFPNVEELIVMQHGFEQLPLTSEQVKTLRKIGFTAPVINGHTYPIEYAEDSEEVVESPAPIAMAKPKTATEQPHSHANTLFILSGVLAAAGAIALVVAFVALSAATGGVAGMVVAAIGLGALLAAGGLFAAGMRSPEANPHYAPAMQV